MKTRQRLVLIDGYSNIFRAFYAIRNLSNAKGEPTNAVFGFVQMLREGDLFKVPGVAEAIDWTRALMALDRDVLDVETIDDTLGVLLKYQDDLERVRGEEAARTLAEVERELAAAPSP